MDREIALAPLGKGESEAPQHLDLVLVSTAVSLGSPSS
jgi:hypothetical protein